MTSGLAFFFMLIVLVALKCSNLEMFAKKVGVSLRRLGDSLDKNGHQLWSYLDGKTSARLLEELVADGNLVAVMVDSSDPVKRAKQQRYHDKLLLFFKVG